MEYDPDRALDIILRHFSPADREHFEAMRRNARPTPPARASIPLTIDFLPELARCMAEFMEAHTTPLRNRIAALERQSRK